MRSGKTVYLSVLLVYSRLSDFCRILLYRSSKDDASGLMKIVVKLVEYLGIL